MILTLSLKKVILNILNILFQVVRTYHVIITM